MAGSKSAVGLRVKKVRMAIFYVYLYTVPRDVRRRNQNSNSQFFGLIMDVPAR